MYVLHTRVPTSLITLEFGRGMCLLYTYIYIIFTLIQKTITYNLCFNLRIKIQLKINTTLLRNTNSIKLHQPQLPNANTKGKHSVPSSI